MFRNNSSDDEDGKLTGVTIELMKDFANYVSSAHNVEISLSFPQIYADYPRSFFEHEVKLSEFIRVTQRENRRGIDFSSAKISIPNE